MNKFTYEISLETKYNNLEQTCEFLYAQYSILERANFDLTNDLCHLRVENILLKDANDYLHEELLRREIK